MQAKCIQTTQQNHDLYSEPFTHSHSPLTMNVISPMKQSRMALSSENTSLKDLDKSQSHSGPAAELVCCSILPLSVEIGCRICYVKIGASSRNQRVGISASTTLIFKKKFISISQNMLQIKDLQKRATWDYEKKGSEALKQGRKS